MKKADIIKCLEEDFNPTDFSTNPNILKELEQVKLIWDHSKGLSYLDSIDFESDRKALKSKIGIKSENKKNYTSFLNSTLKIAAVITIGLCFTFSWVYKKKISYQTNEIARQEITLPDGSKITLLPNSTFSYKKYAILFLPYREVKLSGSAFFNVSPNAKRPFQVFTKNTKVEVLGTSFLIVEHKDNLSTSTYLVEGKVKMNILGENNTSIILSKGESATWNPRNQSIERSVKFEDNMLANYTGKLVFDNTSLKFAINQIEDIYSCSIDLSKVNNLDELRITGTYQNQPVNEIVNEVCLALGLKLEIEKEKMYLRNSNR